MSYIASNAAKLAQAVEEMKQIVAIAHELKRRGVNVPTTWSGEDVQ